LAYHVSGSHTNNVLIGTVIDPQAEDATGKWKAAGECPVLCCLTKWFACRRLAKNVRHVQQSEKGTRQESGRQS
jgi:hypothetical protein